MVSKEKKRGGGRGAGAGVSLWEHVITHVKQCPYTYRNKMKGCILRYGGGGGERERERERDRETERDRQREISFECPVNRVG